MKMILVDKPFASDEEYFAFEERSKLRYELMDRILLEKSGVSIFHNDIVGNLLMVLRTLLRGKNYKLTFENYKVRIPNGNFFYPDLMVC